MVIEVTDSNFESLVLKNASPVLLDFWAEWCVPCKNLSTTLETLSEENTDIVFAKMNVDENLSIPKEYSIRSIPYMLLFRGGDVIDSLIGNQSKEKIEYFIESVI